MKLTRATIFAILSLSVAALYSAIEEYPSPTVSGRPIPPAGDGGGAFQYLRGTDCRGARREGGNRCGTPSTVASYGSCHVQERGRWAGRTRDLAGSEGQCSSSRSGNLYDYGEDSRHGSPTEGGCSRRTLVGQCKYSTGAIARSISVGASDIESRTNRGAILLSSRTATSSSKDWQPRMLTVSSTCSAMRLVRSSLREPGR